MMSCQRLLYIRIRIDKNQGHEQRDTLDIPFKLSTRNRIQSLKSVVESSPVLHHDVPQLKRLPYIVQNRQNLVLITRADQVRLGQHPDRTFTPGVNLLRTLQDIHRGNVLEVWRVGRRAGAAFGTRTS